MALLQQNLTAISIEQAQVAGRELEKAGFIDYAETRAYADAVIKQAGVKYVQSN